VQKPILQMLHPDKRRHPLTKEKKQIAAGYLARIKVGEFHFAVLSVKYNLITNKYNFLNSDYSIYHLITFDYQMLGDGKIKLSDSGRERPE
jgi:hypothetical protein